MGRAAQGRPFLFNGRRAFLKRIASDRNQATRFKFLFFRMSLSRNRLPLSGGYALNAGNPKVRHMGQLNAASSFRSRRSSRIARSCSTTTTGRASSSIRAATSTAILEGDRKATAIKMGSIWMTHGHLDHAGGAMELKEALGVDIVGPHEADKPLLSNLENQAVALRP
jgi:hypothetical protein